MTTSRMLLVCTVILAAGCSRATLTPSHGQSYRAIFARQQARPEASKPLDPAPGLDSQEATIIADSYRTSLAPKGQKPEESPVIVLTPQGQQGSQQRLAPSVPK